MQYRVVPAADMPGYGVGADTVLGDFLVMMELDERQHLLYPIGPMSGDWIDVRLEQVGELNLKGADIVVDTVRLEGSLQAVLRVSAQGHQGFWGGSVDTRCMQLLDVSVPPTLLLKVENVNLNASYGRTDQTTYDDDARGLEAREQNVKFRDGVVLISEPYQRTTEGHRRERVSVIHPLPRTMLPAGRYQYREGHLVRVGK